LLPVRLLWKMMLVPSGDHLGQLSVAGGW